MPKMERQTIRPIGVYGLIRESGVDSELIPEGAVVEAQNFHFDRIGAATVRPGLTAIGATVSSGNSCLGLHNAQSSTALAVFTSSGSSTIYDWNGSSWTAISAGVGNDVIRFVDFAQRTIFFGPAERSIKVYAGSNFDTTSGDPINPDDLWYTNGDTNAGYLRVQFGEVFKSRIYLAGDNNYAPFGSRLWFSSVISSSGNITWSPSTDFVDINPADGEDISALKRFSLELLVYKPNYIYRFRTSGVDPDPLIKIGTRSQESIVEGKRGVYFHHDTGFYRYSGGYPEEISRPISDFVDAIPFGSYDDITGWKDGDHIYWDLNGDITTTERGENKTWKNVVLRYTESSDVWTIYSYSNKIRRSSPFVTDTSGSIMVGLDNGVVAEFNTGVRDLGEPIDYLLTTKDYEFEGIENEKVINELVVLFKKARDAHLMYQLDENDWKEFKEPMNKAVNYFYNLYLKHNSIRFRLRGVSTGEPLIFRGIIITKGVNEGPIKKHA